MSASIPYDHPSLVLGNVINPLILGKLKEISGLQSKTDAAQNKLNSQIALKRNIGMTINEMVDLNADVSKLIEKMQDIDKAIGEAAEEYISVRLSNEVSIQGIKNELADIPADDFESPVDFVASKPTPLSLSSNSLKLDAQYFSYDETNPAGSVGAIENYIKESTSDLGGKASSDISKTASAQINLQQKNHKLSGTLIITANCTHKKIVQLLPCVVEVDKAIPLWNKMYPDARISTASNEKMEALSQQEETKDSKSFSILSGAAYGSSFVGMVHILKQDSSPNSLSFLDLAKSLQDRLTVGKWFSESTGGYGIDSSFAATIKNLLNTQKITAHVTMVVMGAIPSIESRELQMGVNGMTDFNFNKLTAGVSSISNATSSATKTVEQAAEAAKTGAQVTAIQGAVIQNLMSGLGTIDQEANKTIDINSMMKAFENYLQEVKSGDSGVPVNFYLKTVTQQQLARLWLNKYRPDQPNSNPQVPAQDTSLNP